jgi:hypothetical protein
MRTVHRRSVRIPSWTSAVAGRTVPTPLAPGTHGQPPQSSSYTASIRGRGRFLAAFAPREQQACDVGVLGHKGVTRFYAGVTGVGYVAQAFRGCEENPVNSQEAQLPTYLVSGYSPRSHIASVARCGQPAATVEKCAAGVPIREGAVSPQAPRSTRMPNRWCTGVRLNSSRSGHRQPSAGSAFFRA